MTTTAGRRTAPAGHAPRRLLGVVVAHPEEPRRLAYRTALWRHRDIRVVGEATDRVGLVAVARRLRPDVALVDRRLVLGTDRSAPLRDLIPTPVVVTAHFTRREEVAAIVQAGVAGLLPHDAPPHELAQAVRAVADGSTFLSTRLSRRLVAGPEDDAGPESWSVHLTPREREILTLLAWGLAREEIAERLDVTESTVRTHLRRVTVKLEAGDRMRALLSRRTAAGDDRGR